MADRGAYRSILVVLLDGKDFQALSERARWLFVALKMNLGPSGIDVHYRHALAHQLAEQTGVPVDAVLDALTELEAGEWIAFEGNVVWIRDQLKHDPSMKPNDPKHRKSVQRHVMGLPRLGIVAAFIGHYPDWFPADEFDSPPMPRRAIEGPSKAVATTEDGRRKTEDGRQKTEDGKPNTTAAAAARSGGDAFERFWTAYPRRAGSNPKRRALKAWTARVTSGTAPPEIMAGLRRYIAFLEATGKVGTEYVMQAATFVGPEERWKEPWSLERARAPKPPPESEAARQHEELPGSNRVRTNGGFHHVSGAKLEDKEERGSRLVDEWSAKHPDEAKAIAAELEEQMGSDERWRGTPAGVLQRIARAEFKNRVLQRIWA